MTLSALEQIKKHKLYQASHNVWYKKYPYRISLTGYWAVLERSRTKKSEFERDYHAEVLAQHRYAKKYLKNNNCEFKTRSDSSFNFYLKTPEDVIGVLSVVDKTHIIEVNGPLSEKMQDIMLADLTTVFKKNLIYKKYRYKIDVVFYREDNNYPLMEEITNFVAESFEPDTFKLGANFKDYDYYKSAIAQQQLAQLAAVFNRIRVPWKLEGTIYTNNYNDVCTFHLLYKQYIKKTTKVTLLSEIE